MRSKIDLYRRLARLTTEAAVDDFASELADRFGPLPAVVEHLLELARLRIWAHRWGVQEIRLEDRYAVLHYTSREKADAAGEAVAGPAARGRWQQCLSAAGGGAWRCGRHLCRDKISLAARGTSRLESAAFLYVGESLRNSRPRTPCGRGHVQPRLRRAHRSQLSMLLDAARFTARCARCRAAVAR